ncbi:putative ATP-grasp-modified RiPP, partial [Streptomyces niveus]
MMQTSAPWGTRRMGPYAGAITVPRYAPVIDPGTQIAVIVDARGRTV